MITDYDFMDAIQKRFDKIYSYGGDIEKSYWQNVGKIVNKQAFTEKQDSVFDNIMGGVERVMNNEYKPMMTQRDEQIAIDKKTAKHTEKRRQENVRLRYGNALAHKEGN